MSEGRWTPRVIKGGKEDPPVPPSTERKPSGIDAWPRSMLFKDAGYAIKHLDRVREANDRADEIATFLMNLCGYAQDPGDVAERRKNLVLTPLEKVMEYLTDSNEGDWQVHPSFYAAAIVEYADRVGCIRDTVMDLPGA